MEHSRPLLAELAALTEALSEPGVDLQQQVQQLADSVRAVVASCLGVRVTVVVDDYPFTVTALPAGTSPLLDVVAASVSITLEAARRSGTTSSVVFYADNPGAFVDLAADAAVAAGRALGAVTVDAHLNDQLDDHPEDQAGDAGGARPAPRSAGCSEAAIINQAVGVLLGRGHPPEATRAALTARAMRTGLSLVEAAREVVASAGPATGAPSDGPAG